MLDFAKSIMVGNASGTKEFNTEADLRRWCIEHQYTYTPTHGGYYRLEDDKPGRNRPDLEAHVKAGNSKVGNYSADAFLSNAKSFAKEWSAKADGYAKAGDKQGLETLMRSAEAKYDEIKKYQDNAYQAYKDASSVADDYRALGNKISKLLK